MLIRNSMLRISIAAIMMENYGNYSDYMSTMSDQKPDTC